MCRPGASLPLSFRIRNVSLSGAAAADGVIHLAHMHDLSDFAAAGAAGLRAVETIGAALEGSDKPFLITSGTLVLALGRLGTEEGRLGTEEDALDSGSAGMPRIASENAAISLAEGGVRSSIIRLAGSVHGPRDRGLVPRLISIARDRGVSAFVGDGANRSPAVYRLDAALLFRLAMEAARRAHGCTGSATRACHSMASPTSSVATVVSISCEEAEAHFGFLGAFASADNPTSGTLTRNAWDGSRCIPAHRRSRPGAPLPQPSA